MKMTIEEAWKWIDQNPLYVTGNVRFSGDDLIHFIAAYNAITGEAKGLTSCGRCIHNMKHRLQIEMNKR